MTEFEVIDLRPGAVAGAQTIRGHTPGPIVAELLGEPVIRSGTPKNLVAKVYFRSSDGNRNMVRFYRTVGAAQY